MSDKATQLSVVLRPKRISDVIGQPGAVAYVRGMAKKKSKPQFMIFSGPLGTGKTSLARLVGKYLTGHRGDPDHDPDQREVPANVERSIDDVRGLIQFATLLPRGGQRRVIIVDEAHGYVGPAASALLKATEDPPPHVTWMFCTDQPWKLNKGLVTRAQSITLQSLSDADLEVLVGRILDHTETELSSKARDHVVGRIAKMAHGSGRVAVQLVESLDTAIAGGATIKEALELAVESNASVEGFDAAVGYLECILKGDAAGAVKSLGASSGDGVPELMTGMLSGLVRKKAGGNPRDGLGWAAVKRVRHNATLEELLTFQHLLVAGMCSRASSNYAVPADSLLFALAKSVARSK